MIEFTGRMAGVATLCYGDDPAFADVFELTFEQTRKVWQFPSDRFTKFDESDEEWCRYFGIGKEIEITETVTMPRAYVSDMCDDGTIEITCIASGEA